jgi:hypothetical protein
MRQLESGQVTEQTAMAIERAFRRSGGAGGVDQQGGIIS